MGRLLGVVLMGAVVLASGPAEAARSPKEKYLTGVSGSIGQHNDQRLFDDVVNYDYLCPPADRPPFSSGGPCGGDRRTAVGLDWLRSERRLRETLERVADHLDGLDPPDGLARLHAAWISALRTCGRRLRLLESVLQPVDNLDVIDAFQKEVARELDKACFSRFEVIIPAFNEMGYVFA